MTHSAHEDGHASAARVVDESTREVTAQQLLVLTHALAHEGFDPGPLSKKACVESAEDIKARPWRHVSELEDMTQACYDISGDPGFGLVVGSSFAQLRIGVIAMVVPNAPTLRTALDDLDLFHPTVQWYSEISYAVEGSVCTIVFNPMGQTPDARRFRAEHIMVGMVTLLRLFGMAEDGLLAAQFEHDRPAYAQRYEPIFGDNCTFNRSAYKFSFAASLLDQERSEYVASAYDSVRAAALAQLSEAADRTSIAESVRKAIRTLGFKRSGMASVALAMGFNERTLRRHLSKSGVSFQEIFDDLRLQESMKLLAQGRVPLKQIAERTGFETTGNFHRAFKRLTGLTPTQWREAKAGPAVAAARPDKSIT